jgi:hypothetical protein
MEDIAHCFVRNISMPSRRILRNYRNVTGYLPSEKAAYAAFESTLERDFYLMLDFDEAVLSWKSQPLTLEYEFEGKPRQYTPDVLARYDGRQVLYEVKYRSELKEKWSQLKPKFKAAIHYAKQQTLLRNPTTFHIITEYEIRTPYLKNLHFLQRYRPDTVPDAVIEQIRLRLLSQPQTTIQSLINESATSMTEKARLLHWLWCLVAQRMVLADLSVPLTQSTLISWRGHHE